MDFLNWILFIFSSISIEISFEYTRNVFLICFASFVLSIMRQKTLTIFKREKQWTILATSFVHKITSQKYCSTNFHSFLVTNFRISIYVRDNALNRNSSSKIILKFVWVFFEKIQSHVLMFFLIYICNIIRVYNWKVSSLQVIHFAAICGSIVTYNILYSFNIQNNVNKKSSKIAFYNFSEVDI